MRNSFGNIFTLTSFGESHGQAVGGVVDGMPAGVGVDLGFIQHELDRRRPGQSRITTTRKEPDRVELLSGVFEGATTGCPIGFVVRNTSQRPDDYDNLRSVFRPSHADYTYYIKYGLRDHRGGGRASARTTIARCVAGALAKLALRKIGVSIAAYTSEVGDIALPYGYSHYDLAKAEENDVRCPDMVVARRMERLIEEVRADGDTIGGAVTCVVRGCPAGLGEPEFGKLQAQLASAMLSINAAKGFEYGEGFASCSKRGSELNDIFCSCHGRIATRTNHSGGIQGGISNGEDIYFRVAFKPVATLLKPQPTVDIHGRETMVEVRGRHDPCVVPRAVPIVEAMAAMVVLDCYLMGKTVRME